MSGQTIRRSRVAAYLGKGSSFFPWRILGFIRYIYIYIRQLFFFLAGYTGIRDRRGGRARFAI